MKKYVILYLATLIVIVPLDGAWLGFIARDFFKSRLGDLLGDLKLVPAILFYAMYVVGIMIFASAAALETGAWRQAFVYGALFGFFCYATYDLTNLAILRGWSVPVAFADVIWGTLVTGVASAVGVIIAGYFLRSA